MPGSKGAASVEGGGGGERRGGASKAMVMGGDDMAPSISPGESLEVVVARPSEVRLGDVIVFKRYVPIAHRVVGRLMVNRRWYFVTRGDRCPYVDSPVDEGMVLGVVAGKSVPTEVSPIKVASLAFFLLWYIPASRFLRGRTFRRLNALARRFASLPL